MRLGRTRFRPLIPYVIFLLAFGLRLWGNTFGLPHFFHPDETKLITLAWEIADEGKLNPGNFFYPTGFTYLLVLGFKFISFLGLRLYQYQADMAILCWTGRLYSAIFGAATVVLVYRLTTRIYGFSSGIAASIFLCLNFIHLKHSHYATADIASLFFIMLSLSFIKKGERLLFPIFLAAFIGGIATGIKYSAWPIIFPVLLSMFLPRTVIVNPLPESRHGVKGSSRRSPHVCRFCAVIFFYFLGFLFTTPFSLIDLRHFFASLTEILVIPHSKWLGLTHPSPFYYFFDFRPAAGVGIIFIFSILGLISRLRKWSGNDTLLASFFIPYIVMASLSIEKIDRFFLPAIIIFVIWAGIGINNFSEVLARLKGKASFILFGIVVLLSLHPLFKAVRYINVLDGKDSRIFASEWIRKNIPSHTNLALFSHAWANPPLEVNKYGITNIPLVYKNKDIDRERFKLRMAKNRTIASIAGRLAGKKISPEMFQNNIDRLTAIEDFALPPLTYYKERGVECIIISGFFKDDLLDKDAAKYFPKLNSSAVIFFNELERKTELVYSISPAEGFGKDFALGPSIEIYEISEKRRSEKFKAKN